MNETKEAIRKQIYSYINKNIATTTIEQTSKLKELLLAHDKAESKQQQKNDKAFEHINFTKVKIENYLNKSKKLPFLTEKLQTEVATLKLVLGWLINPIE